jgi:hypothetical protein
VVYGHRRSEKYVSLSLGCCQASVWDPDDTSNGEVYPMVNGNKERYVAGGVSSLGGEGGCLSAD